jgi:hypothetical protein
MAVNSNPDDCYKCGEIITFCECDESITDPREYVEWLANERVRLIAENEIIKAEFKETLACRHASIDALTAENKRLMRERKYGFERAPDNREQGDD